MKTLKVEVVNTKRQVVEFIREVEFKMITITEGYLTEGLLGQRVSGDDKGSKTWLELMERVLVDNIEFYDIPDIDKEGVGVYIDKLTKDGNVFFTETDDEVIIYEIDNSIVEACGLVGLCIDKIEIYIPRAGELESAYDKFIKFKEVLTDLDVNLANNPDLFGKLLEDKVYRFVYSHLQY